MITQLQGKLIEKNPTYVVIDCNGVGYELHISLHTYQQLGSEENIRLYTHLQVREDSHTLFGFFQPIERVVFRLLISISGIGSSIARTMLSSMSPEEIRQAIINEELKKIHSIKGIGIKTAQRVLIELKDKMLSIEGGGEIIPSQSNTIKEEALSALEVLGYSRKQTDKITEKILLSNPDFSIEEILKQALNTL